MGEIKSPQPVKLFIGILSSQPELFPEIHKALQRKFGPIDHETDFIPFTFTTYYNQSMGELIQKQFLSFSRLIQPDALPRIKVWTNQLEEKFIRRHRGVPRPINLDPGYLESAKLILASTKNYSHRIYLKRGIYAEVTLHYKKGGFQSFPWTYPDYQTKEYTDFFNQLRMIYLGQLKSRAN